MSKAPKPRVAPTVVHGRAGLEAHLRLEVALRPCCAATTRSTRLHGNIIRRIEAAIAIGDRTLLEIAKAFKISKGQVNYISRRMYLARVAEPK